MCQETKSASSVQSLARLKSRCPPARAVILSECGSSSRFTGCPEFNSSGLNS